jgi:hypothetical protein
MALTRSFDLLQQGAGAHGAFVRFFDALAVIALAAEISVVFATITQTCEYFPLAFLAGAKGVDDKIGA